MNACYRKAKYISQAEAVVIARNHARTNGGNPLPYHCQDCDGWHLTTMPKAAFRRLRLREQSA